MAGLELNDINVHKVLDEIRPYIEADGGIPVSYTHLRAHET